MKCKKCNKEIKSGEGCYNYPSGTQCIRCAKLNALSSEEKAQMLIDSFLLSF